MIYFTGDLNFCDGYFDTGIGTGSEVMKGKSPLRNLTFSKKDYWVGNFEGVCSNSSSLEGLACQQFRITPPISPIANVLET